MSFPLYLLAAVLVTVGIRVIPMMLLRRPIQNRTVRSFLYYVPYVTFTAMVFPAILYEVENPLIGLAVLAIGIAVAYLFQNLFVTVLSVSVCALLLQLLF